MHVIDDNGEVIAEVRPSSRNGVGGARARQVQTMCALIDWARAKWGESPELVYRGQREGRPVYAQRMCINHTALWTLGTAFTTPNEIAAYAQLIGARWTDQGCLWAMVLESGSVGKRWHLHAIVSGISDPLVEREHLHRAWSELVGAIRSEQGVVRHLAHATFVRVYGDGAGRYLAKYLGKDDGAVGYRKFRSSRGLRKSVADFITPAPIRQVYYSVGESM